MVSLRQSMLSKAEKVAQLLGFQIRGGIEVCGAGDCAWEVFHDQLCQRNEFHNILQGREISIQELRNSVVDELTKCQYAQISNGMADDQWDNYLQPLRQPHYYEGDVGDLALPGLAHKFGVNILLLHTSSHLGQHPFTVIPANCFGGEAVTPFPVIMAYNGNHMESVLPQSSEDLNKTRDIISLDISELEYRFNEMETENQTINQDIESCQGDEQEQELPTPPYVPLVTNKDTRHPMSENINMEHYEYMVEEAKKIKNKKQVKDQKKRRSS